MINNKYILICSDEHESSTDVVCHYLNYLSKPFIRISKNDTILIKNIIINDDNVDFELIIKNKQLKFSDISAYWYRRSKIKFKILEISNFTFEEEDISIITNEFLDKEYLVLTEFIERLINKKSKLNKFDDNKINKLNVLFEAKNVGLKIPQSIITSEKSSIVNGETYITKALSDLYGELNDTSYSVMTTLINKKDIKYDYFFHSLLQRLIVKDFELRIFYFAEKFYSSAIFSQKNPKTTVDFRNYDHDFPNRVIPFDLPKEIEKKLKKLLVKLNLNSGSIDMIVDKKGEFIFLEVNPVGQFEQVSFPCRYNIHKKIAEYL